MTSTRRRWATVLVTVLVVIGLPLVVQLSSVQPGAALVKQAFERGPLVKPGAGYAAVAGRVSVVRDVAVPVAGAPDAVLDVYQPRSGATPRPMILWAHGGGWISGSRGQVAVYATMLADRGFTVAGLEYSLAPEERYPVPIRQGNAALAFLMAHAARFGGDPGRVVVGGDSAGAQIASQLAAVQTNPALAAAMNLVPAGRLRGALLFCGLYDMSTVRATRFPALRTLLWSYTGERNWTRYPRIDELSTTRQITGEFPPTYLTAGNTDPFQPQAYELESVLHAHGVPVTTRYWTADKARLAHEYQFDFRTPQAAQVFEETVTFLREHTS